MTPSQMIETFTERHPFVGPVFWMVSIQYYLTQTVVALAWKPPYSLLDHTISDLGNTVCGPYGDRFVCSPLHGWMNASFIVFGITMMIGAILVYQGFKATQGSLVGFSFMGLAGLGTLLVGLFPENSDNALHFIGALLPFLIGNLGLVILGSVLDIPKWLRNYTLISGLVALIGLVLFASGNYFGLGPGGMERVTAYPQTMWLIVFGVYVSNTRMRARKAGE